MPHSSLHIHETGGNIFLDFLLWASSSFCCLVWLGRFVSEKGMHLVIEAEKSMLFKNASCKQMPGISCILQMTMLLSTQPMKEHRTYESLIIGR